MLYNFKMKQKINRYFLTGFFITSYEIHLTIVNHLQK